MVGGEVLTAGGDTGTVIKEDSDVDTHDGNDAATVQIHHEEVLEVQRPDLVVHHLNQTECKHEQDQDLAIHGRQGHP